LTKFSEMPSASVFGVISLITIYYYL